MFSLRILGALGLTLLLGLAACGDGPRQVHLGTDACDHCHMTVSDDRFPAQLVTDRGRTYVFDSIECMAEFLAEGRDVPPDQVRSLWVTHFPEPGRWIEAREALFLRSPELRSPMGLNLSAFADAASLEGYLADLQGEVMGWEEVVEVVRREGVRMGGEGHAH
jgi:copper chaperone NosL